MISLGYRKCCFAWICGAVGCWEIDCVSLRVASTHERADPNDHDLEHLKRGVALRTNYFIDNNIVLALR